MTRHIRLPLGENTTETHCRGCPLLAHKEGRCCRFGALSLSNIGYERNADCRAAEVEEEEDGAIVRLLALLVRAPTDDDGRPEIECSRETLVNMAMAARRELDALRAKTKDEEV